MVPITLKKEVAKGPGVRSVHDMPFHPIPAIGPLSPAGLRH
jgi:hypothetical protein